MNICPICNSLRVKSTKVLYKNQYIKHGKEYEFEIPNVPALICDDCKETFLTHEADDIIDKYLRNLYS